VNEEKLKKNGESRADFFLSVAQVMVCQQTDWAEKYKLQRGRALYNLRTRNRNNNQIDNYLPTRHANHDAIVTSVNTDICQPCAFSVVPFKLNKKS
jgi:hypothetical protein